MSARAANRSSAPLECLMWTTSGSLSRPASTTRSRPRRATPATSAPNRTRDPRAAASGRRYSSAHCRPVGYVSATGGCHPVASSSRRAAGATSSDHGENSRTWCHCATAAPACVARSSTTGSIPRSANSAAAARPTGPAPTTATGNSLMSLTLHRLPSIDLGETVSTGID